MRNEECIVQNVAFCTPHSALKGASCRCRPGAAFIQRKPAGCCQEAKWSQSPVLPWARLAYETRLSAGSTAMEPPPGVAPGSLPYRGGASLTMLWGPQNWRP